MMLDLGIAIVDSSAYRPTDPIHFCEKVYRKYLASLRPLDKTEVLVLGPKSKI